MQTLTKPETCRERGCVIECVVADGGGYWVQHNTESERVSGIPEAGAWLLGQPHVDVGSDTPTTAEDVVPRGKIVNPNVAGADGS
jgi:hypothetical protein